MSQVEASQLIGKLLDHRYRIVRVLAAGGFGHTYLAEDTRRPNCPLCVVKQLKPTNADPSFHSMALKMFQREAEILEQMGVHPQIPQLLAYFEEDDEFYIVQQYIDGLPLSRELSPHHKWAENRVRAFLAEMLEILSFVHSKGVIHRDVKPSNILRQKSDGKLFLIDFGAIKQLQTPSATQAVLTSATISIGTPGYMAIEQGMGKPRPASDIFGLGATAIHAVTGIHPSNLKEDEDGELIWQPFTDCLSIELKQFLTKMVRSHFKERFKDGTEALSVLRSLPPLAIDVDTLTTLSSSAPTRPDLTVLAQLGSPTAPDIPSATRLEATTHSQETSNSQPITAEPMGENLPSIAPAEIEPSPPKPKAGRFPAVLVLALAAVGGLGWWGWQTYENYQKDQLYQAERSILGELEALKNSAQYTQCLARKYEFETELQHTFRQIQQECQNQLNAQTLKSAQELLQKKKFKEAIATAQQVNSPHGLQIINQASAQLAQQVRQGISTKGELGVIEQAFADLPPSYSEYPQLQSQLNNYRQIWHREKSKVDRIKQAVQNRRWQEVVNLAQSLTIPTWQQAVQASRERANRELAAQLRPPVPRNSDVGTTSPRLPSVSPLPPPPLPPPPARDDRPPADAAGGW